MRLLAAIDLSGPADHVLEEIRTWATRLDAVVDLVYVRPGPEAFPYLNDPAVALLLDAELESHTTRLRADLKAALSTLPEANQGAVFVDEGRAATAIVERGADYDALVVATHGRTGFPRAFLGSVAEEVTRRSTTAVIVIRL